MLCDLSDSPEIIREIEENKLTHAIVLPTCKSKQCGGFKCERQSPKSGPHEVRLHRHRNAGSKEREEVDEEARL